MNLKILAVLNLSALVLLYLSFVPYSNYIARILILVVAILLLIKFK